MTTTTITRLTRDLRLQQSELARETYRLQRQNRVLQADLEAARAVLEQMRMHVGDWVERARWEPEQAERLLAALAFLDSRGG